MRWKLTEPTFNYALVDRAGGTGRGSRSDELDPPPWAGPRSGDTEPGGSSRLASLALEIPAATLGTVVGYGFAGGLILLYYRENEPIRVPAVVGGVALGLLPAAGSASGAYLAAQEVGAYEATFLANLIGGVVGVAAAIGWAYGASDEPPPLLAIAALPVIGGVAGGELWSLVDGSGSKERSARRDSE